MAPHPIRAIMNPYYVAPNHQQQGPFDASHIEAMFHAGQLQSDDLCWQEGMADWLPVSEVFPALAQPYQATEAVHNPYAAPLAAPMAPPEKPDGMANFKGNYGGIGRGVYIGGQFLIFSLLALLGSAATNSSNSGDILFTVAIVLIPPLFAQSRLKNIGMNPLWCLIMLIPIVGVLIHLRCLILPEGFADTKKMDTAGKVIMGILVALLLAFVVIMFKYLTSQI